MLSLLLTKAALLLDLVKEEMGSFLPFFIFSVTLFVFRFIF